MTDFDATDRRRHVAVVYLVAVPLLIALAMYVASIRPMDEDGYLYWNGVVRYKTRVGQGNIDVWPGRGVYEVQLPSGLIVAAYTMHESGHRLGSCVSVRETRDPRKIEDQYKIVGKSDGCGAPSK